MKKFISVAPYQGRLTKCKYDPGNIKTLLYENETCFPIIPVIANAVNDGDDIEIISIVADYEFAKKNHETFLGEIEELSKQEGKKFTYHIKKIEIEYQESIQKYIDLFGTLIDCINDEDSLNACISYGTKPIPIVIMMALSYGYKLKSNVTVERLVYGNPGFAPGEPSRIYDISSLFFMNNMIFNLSQHPTKNAEEILKLMIKE